MALNKILILLIALLGAACDRAGYSGATAEPVAAQAQAASQAETAYQKRLSDVWIEGEGEVTKILADDNKGSRHQRFLVKMANGKTLLFAHNVDLAPRLDTLQVGDAVTFRGEYVYNPKGGVIHWTHHNPQGTREAGWLKHKDKIYQ